MSQITFFPLEIAAVLAAVYLSRWKSSIISWVFKPANKYDVTPLPAFDISQVDAIDYRPYATKTHVAMGVKKNTRDDWIRMDRNYLHRIEQRKALLDSKPEKTIGSGPLVNDAIQELYSQLMIDYLPHRYPTIFQIQLGGRAIRNKLTGQSYPVSASGLTPDDMLRHIGLNVEEDFYFMCPDEDGQFRLQGFVACFPSGFFAAAAKGKSLGELHEPVPGYGDRLARGVEKFFTRMKPGDFVGRQNWTVQADGDELFRLDGKNFYADREELPSDEEKSQIHFENCYLRNEHHTLCALPQSKAVIFCVRSYMTPLSEIKACGEGQMLAEALESMPEKLFDYKRGKFWGDVVLSHLKGEVAEG